MSTQSNGSTMQRGMGHTISIGHCSKQHVNRRARHGNHKKCAAAYGAYVKFGTLKTTIASCCVFCWCEIFTIGKHAPASCVHSTCLFALIHNHAKGFPLLKTLASQYNTQQHRFTQRVVKNHDTHVHEEAHVVAFRCGAPSRGGGRQ
jgi:hypothetical protein